MERRNSLSGLNTLSSRQNELLEKTDKMTMLIEKMGHELEKASTIISKQAEEITAQREKNKELEAVICEIINN